MGERGEKKRRSPGQEKDSKKGKTTSVRFPNGTVTEELQTMMSDMELHLKLAPVLSCAKSLHPLPSNSHCEWLYPTAWWSWCFGEWRRRESDQTRHRACWKEHCSHGTTWLLGRQPSVYTTEGTLCLSFIQQSFSENGAWDWNDVKYVGWITHRLSPSQVQSLEERELGSYSSSMG